MKIKYLLTYFSLFFFLSNLAQAQHYLPLLENGKSWDVIYFRAEGIVPAYGGTRFFVEGDTIYQDIPYQILRSRSIYSLSETGLFVPPFAISAESSVAGLIREDTIAKQIYIVNDDPAHQEGSETILYDFDLEVGDTISAYTDAPEELVVLDSIGLTQDLTGQQRRIFYFNYLNSPLNPQYYIEGIGGAGGLLTPFCNCFEGGSGMSCVKLGNTVLYTESVYGFSGNSCELVISSTQQHKAPSLLLYPNPVTHELFIGQLPNSAGTITIYNALGETMQVVSFHAFDQGMRIPTEHFPPGIYYCKIETRQGQSVQKFIKH